MSYPRGIVIPALLVLLGACGEAAEQSSSDTTASSFPEFPDSGLQQGRSVWLTSCKACHATGLAGAPVIGNRNAWQARIAQGKATLYLHAMNGFMGPAWTEMPARGGNDTLSDSDVKAAVDYMVAASQ
jgi:cytochrome c5